MINLSELPEEQLLTLRICDLPISIEGTWLEECVVELYQELAAKGLKFHPPIYLAEEWLTPEDEPIIGVPFYLAHPVLMKLEQKMMLEVEGGTKATCLQLLRHETGHAISYAYRLQKKRRWQNIFGPWFAEYDETYKYRPYSRSYVRHLDGFYAQYHPDEDFAETFSVWLDPLSDWRKKYQGWKALEKLNFVDDLMKTLCDKPPAVTKAKKYWELASLKRTLAHHYKKRQDLYAEQFPHFHDDYLKRIFAVRGEDNKQLPWAYRCIKQYYKEILSNVCMCTGERKYIANDLLKNIYRRCRELKLVVKESETSAILKVAVYLTALVMNYSYTGWFRGQKRQRKK
jgi:hypothetical protein